jgi:endonuclease-3 related protein
MPPDALRKLLLSWTGIGKETADSILCYAFSRDIFVVDTYTRRLFQKLSLPHGSYEEVQTLVHRSIAPSAAEYGDFHARIVKLFATGDEKTFTL